MVSNKTQHLRLACTAAEWPFFFGTVQWEWRLRRRILGSFFLSLSFSCSQVVIKKSSNQNFIYWKTLKSQLLKKLSLKNFDFYEFWLTKYGIKTGWRSYARHFFSLWTTAQDHCALHAVLTPPSQHATLVLTASNQKLFTGIQFSRLRITLHNLISTDTYSKVSNQRGVQITMLMGKISEI